MRDSVLAAEVVTTASAGAAAALTATVFALPAPAPPVRTSAPMETKVAGALKFTGSPRSVSSCL